MKKKIIFPLLAIATISLGSLGFLSSCSQGSSPNLMTYELKVNEKTFNISENTDGSSVVIEENGKAITPFDPNDIDNNKKQYNENPIEFAVAQANWAEANIGYQIGTYIYRVCNLYLNWLTRLPAVGDATTSNSGLVYDETSREFELAYSLGIGEGKDTMRLKITGIELTIEPGFASIINYNQNGWAWGNGAINTASSKESETNESASTPLTVSNIRLHFKYWTPKKGSGINIIEDLSTIQNSNWKKYWKNYQFNGQAVEPTTNEFTLDVNSNLSFGVESVQLPNKNNDEEKIPTGLVKITDIENSDFYNWPISFDVFGSVDDTKNINNEINEDLQKSYDDINWKPSANLKDNTNLINFFTFVKSDGITKK